MSQQGHPQNQQYHPTPESIQSRSGKKSWYTPTSEIFPQKNAKRPSMRSNEMQATHTEKLWNETNTKKKKTPRWIRITLR